MPQGIICHVLQQEFCIYIVIVGIAYFEQDAGDLAEKQPETVALAIGMDHSAQVYLDSRGVHHLAQGVEDAAVANRHAGGDYAVLHQLADYLEGRSAKRPPKLLATWAKHTSEREEIAAEAERGLLEIKKYRLLEDQLQTRQIVDYDAVVSKCTPFGCFVEIPELAVSGLVHVSLLSRRFVKYNESDHTLSAPGAGSWRVGDRMKVHVAKVDFLQRRIDFTPCSRPSFR